MSYGPRSPEPGPRRLLLICGGGIGDLCLLLSPLAAIKSATGCHVSIMPVTSGAIAAAAVAADGRSVIDEVLDWRAFGYHKLMLGPYAPDDRLTELLASCRWVLNYDPKTPAEVDTLRMLCGDAVAFLTSRIRPRLQRGRHLTEFWSEQLAGWVEMAEFAPPRIDLGPVGGDPDRVILAPGAGDPLKCWPIEGWHALRDCLESKGQRPWWLTGPCERDRFSDLTPQIAGATLLDKFRNLINAGLFIGNDSGVSHLAAACGMRTRVIWSVPGVMLHGLNWWRPIGENVEVIAPPALVPSVAAVAAAGCGDRVPGTGIREEKNGDLALP